MSNKSLIIVGASARAAAASAQRAGFAPYWLDQFGDTDLRQRFPGQIISPYPGQAVKLIDQAPDAPFIYTGALENHPTVLAQLGTHRTLLGNPESVCLSVKDPFRLFEVLQRNRIPCPAIRSGAGAASIPPAISSTSVRSDAVNNAASGDWLVKPRSGAGGIGIRRHQGETIEPGYFLQQRLPGESCSAVFVAASDGTRLLGVTRQLVGVPAFHAGEFSYCGSIGPLELNERERKQWENISAAVATGFELRGLFGIDAIRYEQVIHPIEVNPRYTASVEVLELALGIHTLKLHYDVCAALPPGAQAHEAIKLGHPRNEEKTRQPSEQRAKTGQSLHQQYQGKPIKAETHGPRRLIGKAILFAPQDLVFKEFPREGFSIADVPATGTEIKHGHPLLSVIVTGTGIESINEELKNAAQRIAEFLL